eukprot:TRINITY_DN13646_c0_g1_i3.p1 TRINITY_DN13646_c0_g1~~TRINITY_DN13646_c0_g1_i3.p1  ORF type:complete len:547 (+),score=65.48 TRINITY_DN13646_c0_g1_i3:236-1642(+)
MSRSSASGSSPLDENDGGNAVNIKAAAALLKPPASCMGPRPKEAAGADVTMSPRRMQPSTIQSPRRSAGNGSSQASQIRSARRSLGSAKLSPRVEASSFSRQPCLRASLGQNEHLMSACASSPALPSSQLRPGASPVDTSMTVEEEAELDSRSFCSMGHFSARSEVSGETRLSQLCRKSSSKKILSTRELEERKIEEARLEHREQLRKNEQTMRRALNSCSTSSLMAGRGRCSTRVTVPKEFRLSAPPTPRCRSRGEPQSEALDESRTEGPCKTPSKMQSGACTPALSPSVPGSPALGYRSPSAASIRPPGVPPRVLKPLCEPKAPSLSTTARASIRRANSADGAAALAAKREAEAAAIRGMQAPASGMRSPRGSEAGGTRPSTPQRQRAVQQDAKAVTSGTIPAIVKVAAARQKLDIASQRFEEQQRAMQQAHGGVFRRPDGAGSPRGAGTPSISSRATLGGEWKRE